MHEFQVLRPHVSDAIIYAGEVAGRSAETLDEADLDWISPRAGPRDTVFSEANLRRVLSAYVTYYNRWRPRRSLGQAAPCGEAMPLRQQACRKIAAAPVLGGLHHIYRAAA